MSPRPILKSLLPLPEISSHVFSIYPRMLSPHVHFPPTPSLQSITFTHSPNTYDRAPIVVSPNSCALPDRDERVYNIPSPPYPASTSGTKGSYFHPRAFEACQPEQASDGVPELTFSSSSESSDDSDGYGSPVAPSPVSLSSGFAPIPRTQSQEKLQHALSFLPYGNPRGKSAGDSPKKSCLKRASRNAFCSFNEPGLDGCLGGF
ncbi:hypothetical protein BDZ89DRAFT_1161736 [Hymenopellis radicata]|nr:hypothetical protein BDZ89DRAFT_1161736 [Hymenopellis radicata]